ncbi:RRS1-domain-containing protein [Tricholoma matsutake]|nr:RRS1-domain-containing protein [Tricholoma matsutake 945]
MDVSHILASNAAKYQSIKVEKEIPLEVDAGFLSVTDLNPVDEESYNAILEDHLQSLARDGVQALFSSLFSLPTRPSPDGPLAQLPPPKYQLPREKPLPKPKPPTKWEAFAKAKGIQKKVREKKVWDEERQEWVNRWGRDGKNKQSEEQWITEVPANADVDHDPRKVARDSRKDRIAKNEKKHLQNVARANGSSNAAAFKTHPRDERKNDIERTLVTARISTASMGKFDKKLEGEKKLRGVKRKFDPTEASAHDEKQASLALIQRMDSDAKKMRSEPRKEESLLNVRKAVRFASKGRGGLALGREVASGKSRRGGKSGRGKR